MKKNRVNLAQACKMPVQEVASLPIQQLALLLEDLSELKAQYLNATKAIEKALDMRFSDHATAARKAAGKDTGTIRINDGGATVVCDLPKKVEWDQAKLRDGVAHLKNVWEEDPAEYVALEIKVAESKYNAWPSKIRELFEPARTVGVGKPTYKILMEDE